MKKILFVSTTLGNGGAERIISYLLNEFAKDQNKQIILLLLKKEGNTCIHDKYTLSLQTQNRRCFD